MTVDKLDVDVDVDVDANVNRSMTKKSRRKENIPNKPPKVIKNGSKNGPKKGPKKRLQKVNTMDKKQGLGGEVGVLGVGSKVEINYRGQGKYFPGHVAKASDEGEGLWDVLYDDGDTEMGVPEHHLRLLAQVTLIHHISLCLSHKMRSININPF